MLFTGHSEHAIDAKLRLAIPSKHRSQVDPERDGAAWYCVPWADGSLRLYTERTFRDLAARMEQTLTPDADRAELDAVLFGLAERLEMDAQSRIVLPKHHLELTRLAASEVVVIGAGNRLEVRDRAGWLAGQQERFAKLPTLVARIEARRGN